MSHLKINAAKNQITTSALHSLPSFLAFVEVNINALQLKIVIADISSSWIDAMFGSHDLHIMAIIFQFVALSSRKMKHQNGCEKYL